MFLKRAVVFAVVLAVLVTGVLLMLYKLGAQKASVVSIDAIQMQSGIPVEVRLPRRMDFEEYLYCDGNVVADVQAVLRSKLDEVVQSVAVRAGEQVQAGQLLAEFRPDDLEANIEAARVAQEEAANNYERYASLFEQQVISPDRLDQMRTIKESADAALRAAKSQLAFAAVRSPIDGYVAARMVEPGEYKGKGDELLTIVDLATVEVRALVPEEHVSHIAPGGQGQFELESDARWLGGTISRVSPSTDDPNRFFDVYLKVENERSESGWLMRPGMYAEVRFVHGISRDALAVPGECVVFGDRERAVFTVHEESRDVPVEETSNPGSDNRFFSRVRRGARTVAEGIGIGGGVAEKQGYRKADVQVAREVKIRTGGRREGFVQIVEPTLPDESLVILNPRDAIEDGTIVSVMDGGA
jgi:RND family efflux transporter MFP subunit